MIIEGELSQEDALERLGDFVAAGTDGRSDASVDILCSRAELRAHSLDGRDDDAARRASPAAVSDADGALHRIVEGDRDTIGKRQGERCSTLLCDQGVAFADDGGRPGLLEIGARGPIGAPFIVGIKWDHIGSVNLPEGNGGLVRQPQRLKGELTIADHILGAIVTTFDRIQSLVGWGTIAASSHKNTMNHLRELLIVLELRITNIAVLLLDQGDSFWAWIGSTVDFVAILTHAEA